MKHAHSRSGNTMVEAAFLMLILFTILIAVVDFGQVLLFHQLMTERASSGARWAVVHTFNATDTSNIKNMVVHNTTLPAEGAVGLFGLKTSMVTVTPLPNATKMKAIEVAITYRMYLFTPGISRALTRTFRAVRPVESLGATT